MLVYGKALRPSLELSMSRINFGEMKAGEHGDVKVEMINSNSELPVDFGT